jgi:hypothetical protein
LGIFNKVISGNNLTSLAAEWGVAVPPLAKGDEGGFKRRGLTPPVKIPPNLSLEKKGGTARLGMVFAGNRL